MFRLDFAFSHWLYIWYFLYIISDSNKIPNPKFALSIALLQNIIILLIMLKTNTKTNVIIFFILIMSLFKIYPLYTLYNTNIQNNDIYISCILFICYLCWMKLNNIEPLTYISNSKIIIDTNINVFDQIIKKLIK